MRVKNKETGDEYSVEKRMMQFADGINVICYRDNWNDAIYPEDTVIEMTDDVPLNKSVDWEQRRYEIAKDIFCAMETTNHADGGYELEYQAKRAVEEADYLIKELKSKTHGKN